MKIKHWLAVSAAAVLLAACGGGSSEPPPNTVSGTVATGAPLAGASVSLLCDVGGPAKTGTAGASGKYSFDIPANCAAPYMLKATSGGTTLYAFGDSFANINVTPFTDIAAGIATRGDSAGEYDAILAGKKKVSDVWTVAKAAEAKSKLAVKLAAMGVSTAGVSDLLHQAFDAKAGDKLDDALEALKAARGSVSLASLVEQITGAGGRVNDKPWLALFKPGQTALDLVGADCTYQASGGGATSTVAGLTVTLEIAGEYLRVKPSIAGIASTGTERVVGVSTAQVNTAFFLVLNAGNEMASLQGIAMSPDGATPTVAQFVVQPSGGFGATGTFSLGYFGSEGQAICKTVVSAPTKAALPRLDIPARAASFASYTTTAVARDCGTFTYSVSPIGEVKYNGQPLVPTLLDASVHPHGVYMEFTFFATGGAASFMSLLPDGNGATGLSLSHAPEESPPFQHFCGQN